jgi:P63C domain
MGDIRRNADPSDSGNSSDAGKALSSLGASKGGLARAKALTSEQRQAIARAAVEARWRKAGKLIEMPIATHGSPDRPLRIGDLEIPCYVLSDGRRVLVQRGMLASLDMKQGTAGRGGGDRLAKFVATKSLAPFVSKELADMIKNPIRFQPPTGGVAYGYEATLLADLCDAVLAARKAKALHYQQEHIAEQCEILVRGFARVGIIALVDEATGYQEDRAKNALSKILEAFIAKELRKWVSTFPVDYYKELFRLRGWRFPDLPADQRKRPVLVGKITNDVVYDRIAPGVRRELNRLTPRDEKGRLRHKLFQRLTEDVGHPKLREHLASVTSLMKASDSWEQFKKMLDRALPRYGDTPYLPFEE